MHGTMSLKILTWHLVEEHITKFYCPHKWNSSYRSRAEGERRFYFSFSSRPDRKYGPPSLFPSNADRKVFPQKNGYTVMLTSDKVQNTWGYTFRSSWRDCKCSIRKNLLEDILESVYDCTLNTGATLLWPVLVSVNECTLSTGSLSFWDRVFVYDCKFSTWALYCELY